MLLARVGADRCQALKDLDQALGWVGAIPQDSLGPEGALGLLPLALEVLEEKPDIKTNSAEAIAVVEAARLVQRELITPVDVRGGPSSRGGGSGAAPGRAQSAPEKSGVDRPRVECYFCSEPHFATNCRASEADKTRGLEERRRLRKPVPKGY